MRCKAVTRAVHDSSLMKEAMAVCTSSRRGAVEDAAVGIMVEQVSKHPWAPKVRFGRPPSLSLTHPCTSRTVANNAVTSRDQYNMFHLQEMEMRGRFCEATGERALRNGRAYAASVPFHDPSVVHTDPVTHFLSPAPRHWAVVGADPAPEFIAASLTSPEGLEAWGVTPPHMRLFQYETDSVPTVGLRHISGAGGSHFLATVHPTRPAMLGMLASLVSDDELTAAPTLMSLPYGHVRVLVKGPPRHTESSPLMAALQAEGRVTSLVVEGDGATCVECVELQPGCGAVCSVGMLASALRPRGVWVYLSSYDMATHMKKIVATATLLQGDADTAALVIAPGVGHAMLLHPTALTYGGLSLNHDGPRTATLADTHSDLQNLGGVHRIIKVHVTTAS